MWGQLLEQGVGAGVPAWGISGPDPWAVVIHAMGHRGIVCRALPPWSVSAV